MQGYHVHVQDISKAYQRQLILDHISLTVQPGEAVGIRGINGAGKSSLLRQMAWIEAPDSGQVLLDHTAYRPAQRAMRQAIGYAPQDIALFDELSAMDNLKLFAIHDKAITAATLHELIQTFAMNDFIHKRIHQLSGGMKRRVNLAAALINRPRLLIADEPFVGMDEAQRQRVLDYLIQQHQHGMTMIISSHYVENIHPLTHRILRLDNGRIQDESQ